MGRLVVTGPDREALVEHVFSANLSKMKIGKAKYGFLLNEGGFPHDDVIVYRGKEVVQSSSTPATRAGLRLGAGALRARQVRASVANVSTSRR